MRTKTVSLAGWGNYPCSEAQALRPERMSDFRPQGSSIIPRGLGRSYGDATLNSAGHVLLTERLNRFLAFDPDTGILRAEAGVTLEDVLDVFVPRGWFPPVLPGTKFVTLGGAVAADIHGKNHHCDGTFGQHVVSLALVLADGSTVKCSPKEQPELFWATVGGMGLTGLIAEVSIRLRPVHSAYMEVQHTPAGDLETAMRLLESDRPEAPYTVAWIDCLASGKQLGRSVVMTGAHTHGAAALHHSPDPFDPKTGRRWSVPCNFPSWTLNPLTIKAFNSLYFAVQSKKTQPFVTDYNSFFFPLDAVGHWNRIYGKKGFVQYQFVLPGKESADGMRSILERLAASRRASFLAVLKRFGAQGDGMLSFPREGYTLALDIPVRDEGLFSLLNELDALVLKHEGRIYLAKDARMAADKLGAMYPRLSEWRAVRDRVDPNGCFTSDLSRRLGLGGSK